MGLETATYIDGLVSTNPIGGDDRSTSDDHHRLIKTVLKNTFPNATAAINPTPTEFNRLVGVTSGIQSQLDSLSSGKLDTSAKAADSELLDGLDSTAFGRLATASQWTKQQHYTELVLTDGATINWNLDDGVFATVTIAGNRTMALPTNINPGAVYTLRVRQDATGGRTLAWNAGFRFGDAGAPTLSTAANAYDVLSFIGHTTTVLSFLGIVTNTDAA